MGLSNFFFRASNSDQADRATLQWADRPNRCLSRCLWPYHRCHGASTPTFGLFVGEQVVFPSPARIIESTRNKGAAPLIAHRQSTGKDSVPLAAVRDVLVRIYRAFTWRRSGTVFILCLILSTQVLAQPDLFEHWSLERIAEGWIYYLAEVCLTGFAMRKPSTQASRRRRLR